MHQLYPWTEIWQKNLYVPLLAPGPATPHFLPAMRREFVSIGPCLPSSYLVSLCKGWPGNLFVYLHRLYWKYDTFMFIVKQDTLSSPDPDKGTVMCRVRQVKGNSVTEALT